MENMRPEMNPVWLSGRHQEMNLTAGFRRRLDWSGGDAVVKVAARDAYRLWVNGRFAGYGPARAAHGHARADEWNITSLLQPGANVVALEVNAVNVRCYALAMDYPFVAADLLVNGTPAGGAWEALVPGERVQCVPRLSRQRGFAEAYRLTPRSADWRTLPDAVFTLQPVEAVPLPVMLPRRVPYPAFACIEPVRELAGSPIQPRASKPWGQLPGFAPEEWAADFNEPFGATYRLFDLGVNRAGFLRARVRCRQGATLFLVGDELLTGGDVDWRRLEYLAGVRWDLAAGEYELESFEVFTLRYLKAILVGEIELIEVGLREYVRPTGAEFTTADPALGRIFAAAQRTFAANTVDVFMDCPSRERAGWLCDSYFMARVEPFFTGEDTGNRLFLENYAVAAQRPELPAGMLGKCYPADNLDNYIPNWPLWLVLQAAEAGATGFEEKFATLFDYFARYRNGAGLLEKLDRWIFVSWDDSNQHVQDVNYPTNMLYAGALEAAGRLYRRDDWLAQADAVRAAVRRQAWDGRFFVDNAKRDATGQLVPTGIHTEACQYYAFFFGVASPATHPALWRELVERCALTPGMAHPELQRAGALPAHHLRMLLLAQHGETRRLAREIRDVFLPMAELTGTLWEHDTTRASCNHGFASHVGRVLIEHVLGLTVDRQARVVRLNVPDNDLPWCRTALPLETDTLAVGWERTPAGVRVTWERVPADWRVG